MATRRQREPEPDPERPISRRAAITAAARQITPKDNGPNAYHHRARSEEWQDDAWAYFDIIGEVKQATYFLANTVSLAKLFIAVEPDPEQDPVQAPDGMLGVAEARDALERLRAMHGGHGGMLRSMTVNAKVTGEFYLIGLPEVAPGGPTADSPAGTPGRAESWEVRSVSEVKSPSAGRYTVQDGPNTKPRELPDDAYILRVWQRHPEFSELADCSLRGVLSECETLMILSRAIKATARSRTAGAGILGIPSELDVDGSDTGEEEGEDEEDIETRIMKAMIPSIQEEGLASAVVPLILRGPGDHIKNITHITLDRPLEAEWREQRGELTQRLGHGLDIPIEQLTGMSRMNHWCVDAETEALTPDGWVPHDQLAPGSMIRVLDHDTGLARWSEVRDLYRAAVSDEPMVSIEGRTFSAMTTPNHRWPVSTSVHRIWSTTETLREGQYLTTAAPGADTPVEAKYSDALVELVAWFWTEGSIDGRTKNRVTIAQSHTVNGPKVALIRAALTASFGPAVERLVGLGRPGWRESVQANTSSHGGPVTVFHLNNEASAGLIAIAPDKRVRAEFVAALTAAQLELFIDRSLQGDGWHYKRGCLDIFARDLDMLAALEMAGTLAGYTTTIGPSPGGWRLNLARKATLRPVKAIRAGLRSGSPGAMRSESVRYTGTIWCPVTDQQTWLARRHGTVAYTGNSGWLVDKSTWDRYGHPTMLLLVDALTVGYLRPALIEAGISPDGAAKLQVWFDPAGAITDPDRGQSGKELFDRYGLSWDSFRTVLGFSEADAPDDAEIQRRIEIAQAVKGATPAEGGTVGDAPGRTPQGPPAGGDGGSASTNGNGLASLTHITAAARPRRPLGQRLARIDRDLRARIEALADAAMTRALERAGVLVRNRAKKDRGMRESAANVPAMTVPAHFGPAMVASLGFTEDDLLADAFAALGPRFEAKVGQAQDRVRAELLAELGLDEDEIDEMDRRQEGDRREAWLWLAGALATLASQRLYDPSPAPAAVGELSSSSVPPGMIREALARAGGATAGADPKGPMGGVALGSLVMDTFAAHGRVVSGWVWSHGDPDRPFPPHEDLDGQEFESWSDPILAVGDDAGPVEDDFYHPGDHAGCSCDFEPLGLDQAAELEPVAAGAADGGRG